MSYGDGSNHKEPMWRPLWPLVVVVVVTLAVAGAYFYARVF